MPLPLPLPVVRLSRNGQLIPHWALASLTSILMMIAALTSQSYFGRVNLHRDAVNGCLLSTLDRHVNARGWRVAQFARWRSFHAGGPNAANDLRASLAYAAIATSLESRTATTQAARDEFCRRAYPPPSLLPWKA